MNRDRHGGIVTRSPWVYNAGMTEDEAEELIRLRLEARLFNDALYASVRDYQILEAKLRLLLGRFLQQLGSPIPPAD
jgi:hypothetical protein